MGLLNPIKWPVVTLNQLIGTCGNRAEPLWANQSVTAHCDALQCDMEISDMGNHCRFHLKLLFDMYGFYIQEFEKIG